MNLESLIQRLRLFAPAICVIALASSSGCGSKTDPADVVTPPAINQEQPSSESSFVDPPGELELPPGEIPDIPPTNDPDTKQGGLELPEGDVPPPVTTTSLTTPAKIQYASWEEIEQVATTTGRVTVIDIWSTVCAPCLEEFPNLVKLHNELGESIQCISVDVDYDGRKSRPPETYEEDVVKFLTSVGADFPNYISKTPSDDVLDTLKVVSIPTVLVYDAEGKLVRKFVDAGDGFSYEKDVIPLVKKLAG